MNLTDYFSPAEKEEEKASRRESFGIRLLDDLQPSDKDRKKA